MTTKKRLGRLAAGASAFALVGVGLLGTAATAEPGPGNIIGDSGTLTVHKYDGDYGEPGDGTEITGGDLGVELSGVEFIVTEVLHNGGSIDLTDADAWDAITGLEVADLPGGGFTLADTSTTQETVDGSTTFSLPFGLYLVEEGADNGGNNVVSKADPFLVTIPYPADGAWLYDVHVYPKNKTDNLPPQKEVTDPGSAYAPGDEVVWTITKTLPALQDGEGFTSLVFTDELDDRLSITTDDVTVDGFDPADYEVSVAGQTVEVEFTPEGLAKLSGGDTVVVTLVTTVSEELTEEDAAAIANDALVNVNGSEQETNEVAVYYGGIQVHKHNDQDEALAGAEFDVYATDENGDRIGEPLNDAPLVTNANGEFDEAFLVWVGDSVDSTRDYILVETQAPAGYVTPEGALAETPITVNVGETTVAVTTEAVVNTAHDGPNLPLTGAQGTLLFTVVGIGLIGAGAAAVAVRRSRANH